MTETVRPQIVQSVIPGATRTYIGGYLFSSSLVSSLTVLCLLFEQDSRTALVATLDSFEAIGSLKKNIQKTLVFK